jgi:hypothetical protein
MKPTVFPLPFLGFAFRFEVIPVPRRPANDRQPAVVTAELEASILKELNADFRTKLSPHLLKDIGLDRSACD